jgi:hypothetical protein
MLQSSYSFALSSPEVRSTNALLVRDVDGQYRVASADEVLSQAWGVLADRVKPGLRAVCAVVDRAKPRSATGSPPLSTTAVTGAWRL